MFKSFRKKMGASSHYVRRSHSFMILLGEILHWFCYKPLVLARRFNPLRHNGIYEILLL